MNCEKARILLTSSTGEQARLHLETCPNCQLWLLSIARPEAVDERLEKQIIQSITADLQPVRAMASTQRSATKLALAALFVISIGVLALGTRGWIATGTAMRSCVTATIAVSLALGSYLVSASFIPGELFRVRPLAVLVAVTLAIVVPTLVRPIQTYPGFTRATFTCISIGLLSACALAGIVFMLLRRGFATSRIWAYTLFGNFAGLAGFAILFIFCPHVDLGHHLLAHVGMVLISMGIGYSLASRSAGSGSE